MFTRKKLSSLIAGTSLLLCLGAAPAHAGYLSSILTDGVDNIFEDQSREVFFDDGDGVFGEGDILTGFVRIDDKTGPDSIDIDNRMYAIFSQEVISVDGNSIEFGAVTSDAGLSLAGLGVAGATADDMVAIYTNAGQFSVDLILASPGEQTGGGGVTMADYLELILDEGELEMLAGVVGDTCGGGTEDCFQATSGLVGADTSNFISAPAGVTIANFIAGMTTSQDPAGYDLADVVAAGAFAPPAAPFTIAELALKNGAASGSAGLDFESEWTDGSELSARDQCIDEAGANAICGFADDADFVLHPVRQVPEPTTLALLGVGLLGFGATRRQRQRKS